MARDGVRRTLAVLCGLGVCRLAACLVTGNASQCRSGGNAILAVLPVPDATQTAV